MRFVFSAMVLLGATLSVPTAHAAGEIRPERLVCEHLVNPLGIDNVQPRLGWTSVAINANQRGQTQTAYQILVASDEKGLAADQGDLWDSGKVVSDRCAEVNYAGKALTSYRQCYWKVRVWDAQGAASDWSEPAVWSMGILDPKEWQGKWLSYVKMPPADPAAAIQSLSVHGVSRIWAPNGNARTKVPAGTVCFRKTFTLPDGAKFRWGGVILTVDDQFTVYVNGKQIGKSSGQPYAWKNPQRYDMTSALVAGRNVIAVEATNETEGPAGLYAAWKVELEDGKCISGLSDSSWLTSERPEAGWEKPNLNDSQWAKAKTHEMISLTPEDKTAIVADRSDWPQKSPSPVFRKSFNVGKPVAKATVHVCGLGYYVLHLNGKKIGDRVLDPIYTQYDKRVLYATYDVTPHLVQGKNAVGVMLGNGFYNQFARDAWYFERAPWRDDPTMLAQLRIEYADGSSEIIASDATWRASTGPVVHDGIRHGEDYDARLEMPGWDTAAFDDSNWAEPALVAGPKGVLRPEVMPPNRVMQTLTPVSITEPKPGVYVFDMGQNFTGWAQLKVSGPAGTKVKLYYSERILSDGTVDRRVSAPYVFEGPFQTDAYTLKGQGEEVWEPQFAVHGYRWVEVTGLPSKPTSETIRGRVVHTAFADAGSFECSNELLNKIQHMTLWSYRSNFVGYPTDCPHREKNGWTGDAQLASELAMLNFNNVAAYETWVDSLTDAQRPNGMLPGIVPTSGWGYDWGNGPAWDSAFLIIPMNAYLYYGDEGILTKHFDRMKLYVDYLTSRAKNHIVDIGLGDWVPAKTETPVAVTSTAYYYIDALIVAKAATLLGKDEDARKYTDLAGEIRQAFLKTFCKEDGAVANNSQTSLSCALHQGLATPEMKAAMMSHLVAKVEEADNHLDTGILGAKYLFRTLSENGRADVAYRIATQTTPPSYGAWVQQGATTLWEDWKDGFSRNHIMFGDISAWFYQTLAGIQIDPSQPAFKHFFVRPQPVADLKWVTAKHESIYGKIAVAWRKTDTAFDLQVSVPVGTTATVTLPETKVELVTESGLPADKSTGVKSIRQEGNNVLLEVTSGKFAFVAKNPG